MKTLVLETWQWLVVHLDLIVLILGMAILLWLTGLAVLFIVGTWFSHRTLAALQMGTHENIVDDWARNIKRHYHLVLEIGGLFFYLSLPIPMVIILLAGCGSIWFLIHYDVASAPALAAIIIVTTLLASALVKSLCWRNNHPPPGIKLRANQAPELFGLCRNLAETMRAPAIDEIYLTPEAEMAVFTTGRQDLVRSGAPRNCLVIGLGALPALTVTQFKAILAHEIGHLCNRDTAGGAVALYVRQNLETALQIMEADHLDHWYNPAWLFVSGFRQIYLRLSQGASRLQEIMADRLAARMFGGACFGQSLCAFAKGQVVFDLKRRIILMNALNLNRAPNNLYTADLPRDWPAKVKYSCGLVFMQITVPAGVATPADLAEYRYEELLNQETGPLASHPGLRARLGQLPADETCRAADDPRSAIVLIPGITELQHKMSRAQYHDLASERERLTDLEYEKRLARNA